MAIHEMGTTRMESVSGTSVRSNAFNQVHTVINGAAITSAAYQRINS